MGAAKSDMWLFAEVCWQEGQHKAVSWDPRRLERSLSDSQCLLGPAESRTPFHMHHFI